MPSGSACACQSFGLSKVPEPSAVLGAAVPDEVVPDEVVPDELLPAVPWAGRAASVLA
jgi:hypothetical protein